MPKLCARGKRAAKAKFDVYPSAYANAYGVKVCKGKVKGLDDKKVKSYKAGGEVTHVKAYNGGVQARGFSKILPEKKKPTLLR